MDQDKKVNWKSLPPLRGGVWVAMVTEVLDDKDIPNLVKTDLESGGLGQITGTEQIGRAARIQVPEEDYDRAMEVYETLLGNSEESSSED